MIKGWKFLFCEECDGKTDPKEGIITDYGVFICDKCLNEMEQDND